MTMLARFALWVLDPVTTRLMRWECRLDRVVGR